jgi:hypothetical protein
VVHAAGAEEDNLQMADTGTAARKFRWSVLGLVLAVVVAAGALWAGKVLHLPVKAVIAGAVTLGYDPVDGKFSIEADPAQFVTKYLTVKIGDSLDLTAPADRDFVELVTATTRTRFAVPDGGDWTVTATDLAGPSLSIAYDSTTRVMRVDMTHTFVRALRFSRSDGHSGWEQRPTISRARTHTITVDTALLTTGDYTYCRVGSARCGIYLHTVASIAQDTRVLTSAGDPVRIPDGARLESICEAGGDLVRNDHGVGSTTWEYVVFKGRVGYVPAIWTGTATAKVVRVCGGS